MNHSTCQNFHVTLIFPKPEVSHKNVNIDVFALDMAMKLNYWVQITPLTNFAPQKDPKPNRKCTKKLEKQIHFLIKKTLAAVMPLSPHNYVKIDSKLFISVNVSKYIPSQSSNPQKCILPKPEVSQKCKNGVSGLKWFPHSVNVFKLTTTVVLPPKRAFNQIGSAPRKLKNT